MTDSFTIPFMEATDEICELCPTPFTDKKFKIVRKCIARDFKGDKIGVFWKEIEE